MLIDSHTHLDYADVDPATLVDAAWQARVGLIIQSGTDLDRSRHSVRLAERFPEVFATVGFHPQEAGLLTDEGMAGIEELAASPRVAAIGETGFDFYHDNWPHELQQEVFVRHIDLARRLGLPVVVHTRDAADVTLSVLADHADGLTVILHCFSLPDRLDDIIERGYYVSFAGNVTYKNRRDLQAAAPLVPDHLLMLETDAPWMTPVPLRGRPNQPALVGHTYAFVAELRQTTVELLEAQVELNVRRAFPRLAGRLEASGKGPSGGGGLQ